MGPEEKGHQFANIFKWIFFNISSYFEKITTEICFKGTIDSKSAYVQVMAWSWIDANPLPGPMITQLIDAQVYHGDLMI